MRMLTYFGVLAGLVVPALLWTLWSGISGADQHLAVGLVGSILAVAAHSLVILFMLVTGRVLREAVVARELPVEYLDELNEFFAKKRAYPAAILAVFAVVAAAVLGYGQRGFGLSPTVHMLAGVTAVFVNLWVLSLEIGTLRENQRLLDRVARELDEMDRRSPLPETDDADGEGGIDAPGLAAWGRRLALGAWLPYLYWALVVWKGDFSRAALHPWVELSMLGFLVWFLARREAGGAAAAVRNQA